MSVSGSRGLERQRHLGVGAVTAVSAVESPLAPVRCFARHCGADGHMLQVPCSTRTRQTTTKSLTHYLRPSLIVGKSTASIVPGAATLATPATGGRREGRVRARGCAGGGSGDDPGEMNTPRGRGGVIVFVLAV